MTDDGRSDLSLLIDEERPGPSHHRRRRQGPGRRLFAVLLTLVVLGGLLAGVFYGGRAIMGAFSSFSTDVPDYEGSGRGSVEIRINSGDTASEIATALLDSDVIASERAFQNAATANPDSRAIQPGLYSVRMEMSAEAALQLLLDPASRVTDLVTIPEGFTVEQILPALAEATDIALGDYQAAAGDVAGIGLPGYAQGRLEGFLYPSTYELDPEQGATQVLQSLTTQFTTTAGQLQLEERAESLGLTPYEVVVVASMIQSESRIDSERPMIARVIYNRLAQGIPLGIDATSAYELNKPGTELTTEDLQNDTPYNTRINLGLPPTPISNPGEASLEAALSPAVGPWIYYVLEDEEGNHFFTESAAEFEAAKAQCDARGLGCG
ncbi:MAG: endolytic transglycosylase MltG [Geodermatophilaceae bacterium]|nr:endolytic transglycosylase MltG [Geodermatophilaceae bacterium]